LLCSENVYCQLKEPSFTLQGTVTDGSTGEKLIGVNVVIKGTTTGAVTDESGHYLLKVPGGDQTIVFSFIGYVAQEKPFDFTGDRTLNIRLEENKEILNEVQVVSQRKFFGNMNYGREIPTIDSKEIEKLTTNNASDILHARLAGVWATKTSGAPGDQQKIRIRGQASFFSSAEPLYVIDGVPVPIVNLASLGISDLNTHDIENVTVLKDASSSALYGFQGGNGVILIDTKKGEGSKLSFSQRTGFQWLGKRYDLMNTEDFLSSLDLAKKTIGSPIRIYYPAYSDTLCDNDRQDEVFRMGLFQEYQLAGSGKLSNIKYYLSGNYTDHRGILEGSEFSKYTFLAHASTNIKGKLALDLSYRGSYQENSNNQNEYMGNSLIFMGITKAPCLEGTPDSLLYTTKHDLNNRNHYFYSLLNYPTYTPEYLIENSHHNYNYYIHAGSLMGRYQFNSHLSINLMESVMFRNSDYSANTYSYPVGAYSWAFPQKVNFKSNEAVILLNHQANISYNQTFGNHEVGLLFVHRYYADNLHWQVDSLKNSLPDHYYLRNSMAGYGTKGSVVRKIGSYIANASYNYRQRYFVSAIANISHLKEGLHVDYYSVFPSLSLSWDAAKEPFLKGAQWISELNIYTNYGTSGNYPLNGLSNDLYEKVSNAFNDTTTQHPILSQYANHHLKHESTKELDFGLKSSFFDHRLDLTAAFFSKKIGDQIVLRDIPYYYGGGKAYINMGDINVHGYELGVEARVVEQKNWGWALQGNFSSSRQKIAKLIDGKDMVYRSTDLLYPDFIIKEGGTLGDIYGYKYLGKWTKEDAAAKDIHYTSSSGVKYLNADTINNIGVVDADKVVIGNSIPDFIWNLTSSLRYKDFCFDFTIYSSWGMQKYNSTRAGTIITGVNREACPMYSDSLKGLTSMPLYQSSFFIDDASFIRLKNVSVSYEPQKKLYGLSYRVTLSVENLFTITRYRGYDPEATIFTDNNFSDNAVDRGAYPSPRSVFITIAFKL
ncbi:MAG TPA: SusC/RagA family TonB-linked outer membrane protein, partial [Prolixibacteraceae bacterium]|nr:SusC/RagA family TonB-linked outer membrane protein [Prolixibacteraceae bacterium]